MSGLLQRLAAQALDLPPRMRPATRVRRDHSELSADITAQDTDPFAPSDTPELLPAPPGNKAAPEDTRAVPLPSPLTAAADPRSSETFRSPNRVDPPLMSATTHVRSPLEEDRRSSPLASPAIPAIVPRDTGASSR